MNGAWLYAFLAMYSLAALGMVLMATLRANGHFDWLDIMLGLHLAALGLLTFIITFDGAALALVVAYAIGGALMPLLLIIQWVTIWQRSSARFFGRRKDDTA